MYSNKLMFYNSIFIMYSLLYMLYRVYIMDAEWTIGLGIDR